MKLEDDERAFLAAEARALADAIDDETARRPYVDLAAAASGGEVPGELTSVVGTLVGLSLESGRAHQIHGPAGVRALVSVWKRTPQAEAVSAHLDDLNEALTALRGLPVQSVRVAAPGPGTHSISIAAGDREMRLVVDRNGVSLKSVNVGGGGIGE